jgi:hypothetical protein
MLLIPLHLKNYITLKEFLKVSQGEREKGRKGENQYLISVYKNYLG